MNAPLPGRPLTTCYHDSTKKKGQVTDMFCKHCGNQIADNSKFCSICGKTLNDSNAVPGMGKKNSFVSVIVMWAITVFLTILYFCAGMNDGLTADNAFLMMFSTIVPGAVVSVFSFLKMKKIHASDKSGGMQVAYAISIILMVLAILFSFGALMETIQLI